MKKHKKDILIHNVTKKYNIIDKCTISIGSSAIVCPFLKFCSINYYVFTALYYINVVTITTSKQTTRTRNRVAHFCRGSHNPNNKFQHGGNVLQSLKMQAVSCLEKNHFIVEFGQKCRTLNVVHL